MEIADIFRYRTAAFIEHSTSALNPDILKFTCEIIGEPLERVVGAISHTLVAAIKEAIGLPVYYKGVEPEADPLEIYDDLHGVLFASGAPFARQVRIFETDLLLFLDSLNMVALEESERYFGNDGLANIKQEISAQFPELNPIIVAADRLLADPSVTQNLQRELAPGRISRLLAKWSEVQTPAFRRCLNFYYLRKRCTGNKSCKI